jgi:hypothetical protein
MRRFWCGAAAVAALALATASGVSAAPSVSIESAAPGSAAPAHRYTLLIRDLAVPLDGAAVNVVASARGLDAPAKLGTAYVVGGGSAAANAGRTQTRSMRVAVDAQQSVIDTLARDRHATLTLTICPKETPDACTTSGPYPVRFTTRAPED